MKLFKLLIIVFLQSHLVSAMQSISTIKAHEVKNQPFSLVTLALHAALSRCIVKPSHKYVLKQQIPPEVAEKIDDIFFHHMAPFFENKLATDPTTNKTIMAFSKHSFHISASGNRICLHTPKNHQEPEFDVIDLKHNMATRCRQKIMQMGDIFEGESTECTTEFKKLFDWTKALLQLSSICKEKVRSIYISPDERYLLIIKEHQLFLFNIETKTISQTLDPATLQGISHNFNYMLFVEWNQQRQLCIASLPECISQFHIPHGKDKNPTMHHLAEWVASHDEDSIYFWDIPRGNLQRKINLDPSIRILQLVSNIAGSLTVKLRHDEKVKQFYSITQKLPLQKDDNVVELNSIAIMNVDTGEYNTIYDPELTDARLVHVNADHSLAFYGTVKKTRKLWSFRLNKVIQVYNPKLLIEKYKEQKDVAYNYILPTHLIFKGKSFDELLAIATNFNTKDATKK